MWLLLAARFVLVSADASLFPSQDTDVPAYHVSEPGTASGDSRLFRVIKDRGEWLDVETPGSPADAHCTGGIPSLEDAKIRFTVERKQLVPVTTRETTVRFEDGSSLRLPAGVALSDEGGRYRVVGVPRGPSFPLDAKVVGTAYAAPGRLRGKQARDLYLQPAATISVDGTPLRPENLGFGPSTVEDPLALAAMRAVGTRALVTLRRACFEVTAWASPDDVGPRTSPEMSGIYGMLGGQPTFYARRGTRLFWRDGRPAGVATGDLELDAEIPNDDARVCHEIPLDRRSGAQNMLGLSANPPPDERQDARIVLCFSHRDRRAVQR